MHYGAAVQYAVSIYRRVLDFSAMDVLQRADWHGSPVHLGELFMVRKNASRRDASFAAINLAGSCASGWDSIVTSCKRKVCRTQDDVLTTGEEWKTAMIEKGWQ
jgi:hypothetical protein